MAKDTAFKAKKSAPRPHVIGVVEGDVSAAATVLSSEDIPSDWGSLVADLSMAEMPREPEWRVHDRTHLEFAVDYRVAANEGKQVFEWDAYFFVPESLRLYEETYEKREIYDDLQSYVRFAVPSVKFSALIGAPISRLKASLLDNTNEAATLRELRLFACLVRASSLAARRTVLEELEKAENPLAAGEAAIELVRNAGAVTSAMREVMKIAPKDESPIGTAVTWVDEDVSRAMETLLGTLAIDLRGRGAPELVASTVAAGAVSEAVYRQANSLEGVGYADANERAIERLEFRRHVLKRFTSSVLWLSLDVRDGAKLALQFFYALAAGVAMALAFVLALSQGDATATGSSGFVWRTALLVVLAYAIKDRVKAFLQERFSRVVSRHFPDRRWHIRERERNVTLGEVRERSGFVKFNELPAEVLTSRRMTRVHSFEEDARPERVLWHHKTVRVHGDDLANADGRFQALTEIFRLNLRRWLDHTDDPKRKIVFADPDDRRIYTATAPRAYNIAIVYRLRKKGDTNAAWHRNRVVVTRKGILRIDPIS
ncbi:MAG: hypothetical protein IPK60_04610 [Sandaracinaceae bacterium]|jgi:hypothetical protein|nr:hypothetical protein [Sandaracinaceae bacterium]